MQLIFFRCTWVSTFSVKRGATIFSAFLQLNLRSVYNLITPIHLLLVGRRAYWSDRSLVCRLDIEVTCFQMCHLLENCKMQLDPLIVYGSLFTWPVSATFWNQLTLKDLDQLTIPPGAQLRVNYNRLGRISHFFWLRLAPENDQKRHSSSSCSDII